MKNVFIPLFIALFGMIGCSKQPSKVEQMRAEKSQKDSTTYHQAKQTIAYSDSLLQILLPQADSLLRDFKYEKNESYEDHGHYIHRLLQTQKNTARNFLQVYVSDNRELIFQIYYFGTKPIRQQKIRLSVADLYIEVEGRTHSFEAEGWHEILSVTSDDGLKLLEFISSHLDDRILVTASGASRVTYYLQTNEKKALAKTYQLALVMRDIATLERAIHVATLQVEKAEKKKDNSLHTEKKE